MSGSSLHLTVDDVRFLYNEVRPGSTDPLYTRHQRVCVGILLEEIDRLKRGDFTEEEFQALCSGFSEDDACDRFAKGCKEYNEKLFGEKSKVRVAEE